MVVSHLGVVESLSWRSVLAGAVTALAVSAVMAVAGLALGFTAVDPANHNPLTGPGLAFGLWSVLSVVLSLAAGGFLAGFFSGDRGGPHGFMVWCTAIVAAAWLSGGMPGSAMNAMGTAVSGLNAGAAAVGEGLDADLADFSSSTLDAIEEQVNLRYQAGDINDTVTATLRDMGVASLQPEFLRAQIREARSDLRTALRQTRLHRDRADAILNEYLKKQQDRIETLQRGADREAGVRALMIRHDITREEAEAMADDAIGIFNLSLHHAVDAMAEARQQVQDAELFLQRHSAEKRAEAETLAAAMAGAALLAGLALILGAVVASLFGYLGARCTREVRLDL